MTGWIPGPVLEARLGGILPFYGVRSRLKTHLVIEHNDPSFAAVGRKDTKVKSRRTLPDRQSEGMSWARLVEEAKTSGACSDGGSAAAGPRFAAKGDRGGRDRHGKDAVGVEFSSRGDERRQREQLEQRGRKEPRDQREQGDLREQREQRERERPMISRNDGLRRPEELAIQGHVCRSRIPRPCKFGSRCRDPWSCDYCHDDAHFGKRVAKAWLQELQEDASCASGNGASAAAIRKPPASVAHTSRPAARRAGRAERGSANEYVGRFFPQSVSAEEDGWPPFSSGKTSDGGEADEDESGTARPPAPGTACSKRAGAEPRRVSFADPHAGDVGNSSSERRDVGCLDEYRDESA